MRVRGQDKHEHKTGWARPAAAAACASALTLLATSGLVGAQASSEQIHACAGDRGVMRIVSSDEACGSGETRVVWNAQGPQGQPGEIGPAGLQGLQGPPGPRGQRGKPGKPKIKIGGEGKTQLLLIQINKKLSAHAEKTATKLGNLKTDLLATRQYLQNQQHGLPNIAYNARNGCLNAGSADYFIKSHGFGDASLALGQAGCK